MATFTRIPRAQALIHLLAPHRAATELYRAYLRQLGDDEAGRLEIGPDDRPTRERARLKAAATAENVRLEIRRKGNAIVFWKS